MRHGSLFSGIGGFDLAAQWMGWENVFHCEKNEFGRKVLNHYWPESISYEDVTKTDFTIHRGAIDILTGGFPCQPYSTAGKRLGKEDDRHLWPEILRAIREIKPTFVVGENVRGLLSWNGGLVFDEVQTDLEAQGYEVVPFLLPACAVNAPHRRDRIWFVAFNSECATDGGYNTRKSSGERVDVERNELVQARREQGSNNIEPSISDAANPKRARLQRREFNGGTEGPRPIKRKSRQLSRSVSRIWQNFPTQSPVCGGDDGLPAELDGITLSRHRRESIKAYGNAIVPQVSLQIFKAIEEASIAQ